VRHWSKDRCRALLHFERTLDTDDLSNGLTPNPDTQDSKSAAAVKATARRENCMVMID